LGNVFIELLGAISSEAIAPKEKQKRSVVKALLSELSGILGGIGSLVNFWEKAKGIFEQVFGA
jgi:hypothetical protein